MVTHKSSRGGNFSPSKNFVTHQDKVDFETGQYAAISGKHSDDNPFKLPRRRLAWQTGFRNATYENTPNTPPINTESTHSHIVNLRNVLSGDKATIHVKVNKTYKNE